MKVVASAISDRGRKREGNEDQYLIDESLGLYMVCDGMGGHAAGEVAAERAIAIASARILANKEFVELLSETPDGPFQMLKIAEEAVQAACQGVFHLANSSSEYAGMGTTLTMLIIAGNKAIMAHVGDSRLYLMRKKKIHQLSVDHTLANELYQSGGLTKEEAATSQYQNVLTRCVGSQEFVKVDTLLFDLMPRDRLLLCSDGLSNYFSDPAVIADLLAKPEIVAQPEPLVEHANESGGADNITAVVIEALLDSDSPPVSDTEERLETLRRSFLGRKLSVSRLLQLLSTSAMFHCNSDKTLIEMGDKCPGMFFVIEGSFRVLDDDIVESELSTGECFGEATLIAPAKSPATLIASEPSRVLIVDRKKFNRLTRRMPRLGNALLRNLSRHLSERIVSSEAPRPISLDDTGPLI